MDKFIDFVSKISSNIIDDFIKEMELMVNALNKYDDIYYFLINKWNWNDSISIFIAAMITVIIFLISFAIIFIIIPRIIWNVIKLILKGEF